MFLFFSFPFLVLFFFYCAFCKFLTILILTSKKLFTQLVRHCSSSEVSAASSILFTQFLKQLFVNSCICIWTLCLEFSVSRKDVISCFSESLRLPKSLADTLDIVENISVGIACLLVCISVCIGIFPSNRTSYALQMAYNLLSSKPAKLKTSIPFDTAMIEVITNYIRRSSSLLLFSFALQIQTFLSS